MRAIRPLTVLAFLTTLVFIAPPAHALAPGSLDPTFGNGGKATALSQGSVGYAVMIDSHGRVVTAGYTLSGRPDFVVARFLQNGTLDTAFGNLGRTVLDLGGADYAFALDIQPDGKIVLAGESDKRGKSKIALARFRPNGRVDTTFGGGDGSTLTSFRKDQQAANAVIVTPDEKIVVAGFTSGGVNARSAIVRYGMGGRLDRSFSGDGRVSFDLSKSDEQFEAISWDEGHYILAGYAEANRVPAFSVADVTTNGKLNPSFSRNGYATTNVSNGGDVGYDLIQQPDGKIVVAGGVSNSGRNDWGVVRYLPGGGIDHSWGNRGKTITSFGKAFDVALALSMQTNGKIVVAGRVHRVSSGSDFGLVRYNTDGAPNKRFGNDGKVTTDFAGGDDGARGLVIWGAKGKIVAVGDATKNGVRRLALARYAA
jgi:uncharacterized delta-60 repeat protein